METGGGAGSRKKHDDGRPPVPRRREKGEDQGMGRAGAVLVVCLVTLPFLVFFLAARAGSAAVWWQGGATAKVMTAVGSRGLQNVSRPGSTTGAGAMGADELFGGLFAPSADRAACLSRHQSPQYYKHSPYAPSSHLLQKLRDYEARHRTCGPGTPLYDKSVEQLRSGRGGDGGAECKYVVWLPYNGLGNRMLSLLSTFLYALLTDRVLLVRSTDDFTGLFCEPFPGGATWVLPPDFPIADMSKLGVYFNQSYGNLLGQKKISNDPAKAATAAPSSMPPYVYLHLAHDLRYTDRLFYCNDDQLVLAKVNWLLLQNDFYFVPSLYSIAAFQDELRLMFPAKESVSHLLGRYLFHPSNSVWGMVTRYYHSYLAMAEERIGVQVRMFSWASIPIDDMYKQIMACSAQGHILPDIAGDGNDNGTASGNIDAAAGSGSGSKSKSRAILIASLHADYYERIKSAYYEHAAADGGRVGVFQPSHEERQTMGQRSHNQKALAEIYLLSFSDVLLTTGMSTFGYMSSSLAGLRPAMLLTADGHKPPAAPCVRAVSMEPCFHMTPNVKCQGKGVNKEDLDRHVKACEDLPKGIKLFD